MNQDSHTESFDERGGTSHFFVVADGMGAHAAGELASQIAVQEMETHLRAATSATTDEALVAAIKTANDAIYSRGQQDTQLYNMGTTCTALVISPEGAWVGHVGDSRAYRCRDQVIQQLTFDHSLVWEMRAAGQISRADHESGVPRNVITRCLGPHADVEADIEGPFSIQQGDVFVLCSDGLTGRVSDTEVGIIAGYLPPEEAVQFLVDLANLRGGSDNVTVVIIKLTNATLNAPGLVNDTPPRRHTMGTHAGWWFGAAVGLLAVLLALAVSRPEIVLLGGGLFLLSALGAGIQWMRQQEQHGAVSVSPYVTADAKLHETFVDGVLESVQLVSTSLADAINEDLTREITAAKQLSPDASSDTCRKLAGIARKLVVQLRAQDSGLQD